MREGTFAVSVSGQPKFVLVARNADSSTHCDTITA